jgi:isoquinoline 1-oxidoreductase beta subunit
VRLLNGSRENKTIEIGRRAFIKISVTAAGSLAVQSLLPALADAATKDPNQSHTFNYFLEIGTNGRVTFRLTKPEIGQGIDTGISMFVCDELGAAWDQFDTEIATYQLSPEVAALPREPQFYTTGASNGIRRTWVPLRTMAATVRDLFERAAAQRWDVEQNECSAKNGHIHHSTSERTLSFAELIEDASRLTPTDAPRLKSRAEFSIIGNSLASKRILNMVRGEAKYSIDIDLPDMLLATIERAPTVGGRIRSVNDQETRAIAGVIDVVRIDGFPADGTMQSILDADFTKLTKAGVAVLAKDTWSALKGRRALNIAWEDCPNCATSIDAYRNELREVFNESGEVHSDVGDVESAMSEATTTVSAEYENPFQASFGMEPLNATARMTNDGGIEIWAGSQSPQMTSNFVSELLDIAPEKVVFHNSIGGGGFGRRYYCDFVAEAALLAKKTGRTVKLLWTREDDIQHSKYHAFRLERHRIGLDNQHRPTAWDYAVGLGPNDYIGFHGPYVPYFMSVSDHRAQSFKTDTHLLHRGSWRSVMLHPQNVSLEGAVDEVAREIGEDPLDLRLRWLTLPASAPNETIDTDELESRQKVQQRASSVLREAAAAIDWARERDPGSGVGIALGRYVDTFVGQAAEVVVADGKLQVKKIVCAFDCGLVINPDLVRAQVEGSIVWALGPVLFDAIDVRDGRVVQSNFHDYRVPRMADLPDIEVILVDSDGPPAGAGEPAVLGVAPAVMNAVYAATGQRVRSLPVRLA